MSYIKTQWQNNQEPAINAENLNKMEQGIYEAHSLIPDMTEYYDKSDVDALLEDKADTTDIPTKTSDLTNDGDGTNAYLTQHQSLSAYRTSADQDAIDATKSNVSVSSTGTSTDEVNYITIDGVEKKIAGRSGGGIEDAPIDGSRYARQDAGWVQITESGGTVNWADIQNKPTEFNPTSHTHTKSQITDYDGISDAPSDHKQYVRQDGDWEEVEIMTSVDWNDVENKPSTFPPESHNHDDRYYTEAETDTLLDGKENKGKITINGTEETVTTHTLTITDSGVTTSYTLLGL